MRIFDTIKHSLMHGESGARDSFEDTSICVPRVIDLHVEFDSLVHPGSHDEKGVYRRLHEYARSYNVMSDSS
jgi:hypothetical protein